MLKNKYTSWSAFLISAIVATLLFLGVEYSNLDLIIQDLAFNFQTMHWVVSRNSFWPKLFFYDGIKYVLGVYCLYCLIFFLLSFKIANIKPKRWIYFYLILSMVVIPTVVSSMKASTNTYCPWDITRYGGGRPYVKVIESYPPDYVPPKNPPKCFPAGHASGGLALLSLFFVSTTRKQRLTSLGVAFTFGGIMGLYQTLKGAHYFSHTLATFILSWLMSILLFRLISFLTTPKSQ